MRIALALVVAAIGLVPAASARPPRLVETCLTKAERTHVLRYRASWRAGADDPWFRRSNANT